MFVLSHGCCACPLLLINYGTNMLTQPESIYDLTSLYPNVNSWVISHSLGGSLALLLGVTFGVPVLAFKGPGEHMATQRSHLPSPIHSSSLIFMYACQFFTFPIQPSMHHITHGGPDFSWHSHTPIFNLRCGQVCNGEPASHWKHH